MSDSLSNGSRNVRPIKRENEPFSPCQHYKKLIPLRDNLLEDSKTLFMKKHLQTCGHCKKKQETIRKAFFLLSKNIPLMQMGPAMQESISGELKEISRLVFLQMKGGTREGTVVGRLNEKLWGYLRGKTWVRYLAVSLGTAILVKILS